MRFFKDVNLRYAFAHAMNVEKVIADVLRNDYFRLESAYVGYGPYTNKAIQARRYDYWQGGVPDDPVGLEAGG